MTTYNPRSRGLPSFTQMLAPSVHSPSQGSSGNKMLLSVASCHDWRLKSVFFHAVPLPGRNGIVHEIAPLEPHHMRVLGIRHTYSAGILVHHLLRLKWRKDGVDCYKKKDNKMFRDSLFYHLISIFTPFTMQIPGCSSCSLMPWRL